MDEGVGAVEDSLKGLLSLRKLCILISVFGTAIAYGLQGNAYLFSGCERQMHSMRPGDSMNLWEGHERPGTKKSKSGSPRALIRASSFALLFPFVLLLSLLFFWLLFSGASW